MTVNLNKIKGLMAEHGDTQKDLAEKLGLSRQMVSLYMTGGSAMSIATVTKIARIYGVSPFDLLKEE